MNKKRATPLNLGNGHYCYTENCAIHDSAKLNFIRENLEKISQKK